MLLQALVIAGVIFTAISSFAQTSSSSSSTSPSTSVAVEARSLSASAWTEAARISLDRANREERETASRAQNPEAPKRTRLQLGVALKQTVSPGSDTDSSFKPTFVWRWRGKGSRTDDRLSPAYRLSSYKSIVHSQIGGQDLEVGDVKVRTLMLGLDYKMPRGKWNWAAGMSLGWALNDVEVPWQMRAIANDAGTPDLWVDVHNSLVWGPRLKGWYERDRRISFMVESAYLVTRPSLDVRSNGITTSRRLNADAFILKAGIVYGIF